MINQIHNMDCIEGMKKLTANSIDLVVTSPPYYNAREYSHWETVENYLYEDKRYNPEKYKAIENIISYATQVLEKTDKDIVNKTNKETEKEMC